jgi:tetratricopeptide (TPR) repeat protein
LNPRLAEAHKAEALVLRYTGDRVAVGAALRRAVEANPRHTPALINLGVDRFGVGDLAGHERLLRRVAEMDPQEIFCTVWLAVIAQLTGRLDESLQLAERLRTQATDPFYKGAVYYLRARVAFDRGDLAAAQRAYDDGVVAGADPDNMQAILASIDARAGRADEARQSFDRLVDSHEMRLGTLMLLAGLAARFGDIDRATTLMNRRIARDAAQTMVRLVPELHPLLGHQPFSPRQWDTTLVWPLEAPMIDRTRHALFKHVRIESGLPDGSDVRLASNAP